MMTLQTEFIPAAEKDSRRLMVMLHGLGDSASGYHWMPGAMNLPWLNFLLVNAPEPFYTGRAWFDIENEHPGILRSRQLLFHLLDDLRTKNFPAEQITLGGFSQGCLMTIDVGLRYPHKLAGLVGISGWVYEVDTLLKEMPPVAREQRLLSTHGSYDTLLPIKMVRAQINALKAAELKTAWHEFPKAHSFNGEEELAVIRDFVRSGYAVADK